jgi:hypothetical protein
MKFFLKYLVPLLAIAVFVLCLVAAFFGLHGEFSFCDAFQGGFPTYFIAKGIFCSTALFLLGKLVEGTGKF